MTFEKTIEKTFRNQNHLIDFFNKGIAGHCKAKNFSKHIKELKEEIK